jgi:hypothetical protein
VKVVVANRFEGSLVETHANKPKKHHGCFVNIIIKSHNLTIIFRQLTYCVQNTPYLFMIESHFIVGFHKKKMNKICCLCFNFHFIFILLFLWYSFCFRKKKYHTLKRAFQAFKAFAWKQKKQR